MVEENLWMNVTTVLSQSLCWCSYSTWKMCCSLHDDLHKQPSDLDLASPFFPFYHQAALWDLHKIIWGTVLIFLWLTFGKHPKSITALQVCWWYAVWCIQRGWKPYVSACRCRIETQILRTQLHHAWLKQLCVWKIHLPFYLREILRCIPPGWP